MHVGQQNAPVTPRSQPRNRFGRLQKGHRKRRHRLFIADQFRRVFASASYYQSVDCRHLRLREFLVVHTIAAGGSILNFIFQFRQPKITFKKAMSCNRKIGFYKMCHASRRIYASPSPRSLSIDSFWVRGLSFF